MKTTKEILALLQSHKSYFLEKYKLERIGVFGSVARNEQTEDSDVDICYEGKAPSLLTLDRMQTELEKLLKCSVDLVRIREQMDIRFKNHILNDVIYVYGMVLLDAICMNLIALGETTKGLDKITKGTLWAFYPEINWQGIMRMRDKIAHHYFDVDAEVVFNTIKEDIPLVIPVINRMIADLEET